MLEIVKECPVCGNDRYEKDLICEDYSVTKEKFEIVKCRKCEFRFTNPRPLQSEIGKYYQSSEYISHQDKNKGLISTLYYLIKQKNLKRKLQLINKLHKKGELLDIGCGTGSFLEICKSNNWNILGIEPDVNARNKAIEKTGSIIKESVNDLPSHHKYDVITMWHVLEHIHTLNDTIKKISSILSKDGKLIIAVPNRNSYDARKFGEYWAAYDIPRHLYHFTQTTLIQLMNNHKLKFQQILPMKYDAYYISLMSLKYKNKRAKYFSALITGFHSNQWAKNNNNEYSSLTYIFTK